MECSWLQLNNDKDKEGALYVMGKKKKNKPENETFFSEQKKGHHYNIMLIIHFV